MKRFLLIVILLLIGVCSYAQKKIKIKPCFQQNGIYFSSNNITVSGYGAGSGVAFGFKNNFIAQTDMNIYWLNGNAFSSRISAGFKKSGRWTPALYGNISLIYGSHTEVLYEDGSRPVIPVTILGMRIAPLRFENDKIILSAFELGYGISKNRGRCTEITLLLVGFRL